MRLKEEKEALEKLERKQREYVRQSPLSKLEYDDSSGGGYGKKKPGFGNWENRIHQQHKKQVICVSLLKSPLQLEVWVTHYYPTTIISIQKQDLCRKSAISRRMKYKVNSRLSSHL